MANPKSRVLPQIFNVFLFVMVAHCADAFVLVTPGDMSILGTNLYGHFAGILCVFVACLIKRKDVRMFGLRIKPKKIFKRILEGAVFALIPIAIVCLVRAGLYTVTQNEAFKFAFIPPNHSKSPFGVLKTTLIYAAALLVSTFMKELFFRGYIIRSARPTYSFADANIVQAALCCGISIATIARNFTMGQYGGIVESIPFVIMLVLCFVVHDFISGIKWGLLFRAKGDIWASFFDHWIYRVLAYSLFVSQTKVTKLSTMIYLIAVQAISFVMVYFYYKKERAKKKKKSLEREIKKIENNKNVMNDIETTPAQTEAQKANADKLEDFSHDEIRKKVAEFSSVKSRRHGHRAPVSASEENNDIVSLDEGGVSKRVNEYKNEMISSIGKHSRPQNPGAVPPKEDDELLGLRDIKIDEFYQEYAREMQRKMDEDKNDMQAEIDRMESEHKN